MNPYRNEPRGGHWRGPRGSYFGRGGVKFAILGLLKEQPRHGYDIIREMEQRSGGVYSPSPGVIYPTLQALEDQDYIKSSDVDGKKVYAITDAGLAYLQQNVDQTRARSEAEGDWAGDEARDDKFQHHRHFHGGGPHGACGPHWAHGGPEGLGGPHGGQWEPGGSAGWGAWFASSGGPEMMREMRWMFHDFAGAIQRTLGDKDKMKEIREVLREAKTKIDEIVMK